MPGKQTQEIFEVDAIIDKRVSKRGKVQYLIKWKGFPSSANSWEPFENIEGVTPGLVASFETEFKANNNAKPEKIMGVLRDEKSLVEGPPNHTFVVIFSDGSHAFVPRKEAHKLYPQLVISYYESCVYFADEFEEVDPIKNYKELKRAFNKPSETLTANEVTSSQAKKKCDSVSFTEDQLNDSFTLLPLKIVETPVQPSATQEIPIDKPNQVCLVGSSGQ